MKETIWSVEEAKEKKQAELVEFYKRLPVPADMAQIEFGDVDGCQLAAPKSFWYFRTLDLSDIINGCGPGGAGDRLIPDTVYGLSVKPACAIHDWMYTIFNDEAGFKLSNSLFLDNMTRINKSATKNSVIRFLRSRRIVKYYLAVKDFGRLFYYDNHVGLYDSKNIYQ